VPFAIEYFNRKVEKEREQWPVDVLAHNTRLVELLIEFGPDLPMPHSRTRGVGYSNFDHMGAQGLGALYCFAIGQNVIVLHAFIKKTPDTPERDLRIARSRLKTIRHA